MEANKSLFSSLVLCQYLEKKRIYQEIMLLRPKWRNLTPHLEYFAHNNGVTEALVNLKGTILITYKGCQYDIPLVIWIHRNYPNSLPSIFLLPTGEVRIRVTKYVDRNGEVNIPLFSSPIRFPLETLIQFLRTIFQDNPPLYIKKHKQK